MEAAEAHAAAEAIAERVRHVEEGILMSIADD